jgi:pimeloyl-ACP methyl ester carboxylesterase
MERRDLFVSASDGLKLYAWEMGPRTGDALPVVCLPGLARTSADFAGLAACLASDPSLPRRVLALDYRGRGRSERDPDWRRYEVRVELDDVLQVLTAAGIAEALFVGTSRGGLITMAIGAARPALLRGVVLNDIGPVIEGRGLERIRGYVGKLPSPGSYAEAVEILKRLAAGHFTAFVEEDWETMARTTWREDGGRLVPDYDPALMRTLEGIDFDAGPPALWPLFEPLKRVPVLVLRGENSDVLSAETLRLMERAHPRLRPVTVPGQGHAPLLKGDIILTIKSFLDEVEERRRPR